MTNTKGRVAPNSKAKAAKAPVGQRDARSGRLLTSGPGPEAGYLAKTKLKKAGGSLVATMPAAARNLLHLSEGQEMAVTVEGSKVIMEALPMAAPLRVRRPKYTLDELLANAKPTLMSDEEEAWQDAPPVGREVW